jgi:hypothetical protein
MYQNLLKQDEDKVTILWKQQVHNDATIPNNKLDLIVCSNEKGAHTLIDAATSEERKMFKKEAKKLLKYITTEDSACEM